MCTLYTKKTCSETTEFDVFQIIIIYISVSEL